MAYKIFNILNYSRKKCGKAIIIVKNLEEENRLLECVQKLQLDWLTEEIRNLDVRTVSFNNSDAERNSILYRFQNKSSTLCLLIVTGSYLVEYDNQYINTIYVTCPISNQLQYRLIGLLSRPSEDKFENAIVDFVDFDWFT